MSSAFKIPMKNLIKSKAHDHNMEYYSNNTILCCPVEHNQRQSNRIFNNNCFIFDFDNVKYIKHILIGGWKHPKSNPVNILRTS